MLPGYPTSKPRAAIAAAGLRLFDAFNEGTNRIGHFVILALCLLLQGGAASGSSSDRQGSPAVDVPTLSIGEEIRLQGIGFTIEASPRHVPDDRPWVVDLDLYARPVVPGTQRSRNGSYFPWLDVRYSVSSMPFPAGSGSLQFHRAAHGPAYGGRLELDATQQDQTLILTLTVDYRDRSRPTPASLENWFGSIPKLPLTLTVRLDPSMLRIAPVPPKIGRVDKAASDNLRLELIGSLDPRPGEGYADIWGYSDGTTHLAIVGARMGTLFIDVTNPFQPVEVGYVPGPTSVWRDIKTYQDYAYIVTEGVGTGEGMQIVSLADPASPTLVNTVNQAFTTAHNIFVDEAQGRIWCFGTDNATRVFDLTIDPVNPTELGAFLNRYVHDGHARGDLAYFSEINDGRQEIVDTSNLSNIRVLSSFATPFGMAHNCWPNEDETVLAVTDEADGGHVTLWDITSKTGPNPQLGAYVPDPEAIVHSVFYDDDDPERAVVSHYRLGTKYVDLHRPSFPVELGSYDSFPDGDTGTGGVWGVYPFDPRGYIYSSDISSGLLVFRHIPTGGTLSGVVRSAEDGEPLQGVRIVDLASGETVVSKGDGVYAFYAGQGDLVLRVSARGYLTRVVTGANMPLDGRVDLDIDLEPTARAPLSGVVRRVSDRAAVAGARVTVLGLGEPVTTMDDGSYSFPAVGVGQRVVTAEAFGYASHDQLVVLRPGAPDTQLGFTLADGRFADDAEQDRGFVFGEPDDTNLEGTWVRVDPNGTAAGEVQPEDDNTAAPGTIAFITGQSSVGASPETNDVDGGTTTLTGPLLDASGMGAARLGYQRWMSSDYASLNGGSLRVQLSPDDGDTWTTVELVNKGSGGWRPTVIAVDDIVPLTDQLRLRFRAEGNASFSSSRVLECGADDVELVSDCRTLFSPWRPDGDRDGLADACDPCPADGGDDADGDGWCGDVDNAPFVSNPFQRDPDGDGVGNIVDNCRLQANPYQRDLDRDGLGDACDDDLDGDGLADAMDDDDDDDGFADDDDTCPTVRNAWQADQDLDGEGDLCDPDDGVVDDVQVDKEVVRWAPEVGTESYDVYRGDLGHPALFAMSACLVAGVPSTFHIDQDQPSPGDGFLYLVTDAAGGSPGHTSAGEPRFLGAPCP